MALCLVTMVPFSRPVGSSESWSSLGCRTERVFQVCRLMPLPQLYVALLVPFKMLKTCQVLRVAFSPTGDQAAHGPVSQF